MAASRYNTRIIEATVWQLTGRLSRIKEAAVWQLTGGISIKKNSSSFKKITKDVVQRVFNV